MLKNIFNSPKSTVTGLTIGAAVLTSLSQSYPSVHWLAAVATAAGVVLHIVMAD